ncbi:head-tail adaptor protein [Polymorphum gilvum]|uniref:head-tail adaptor protein n=1 Tax=Polymorphum gilvum TaxID=991904 RepID=UPI0009FD0951
MRRTGTNTARRGLTSRSPACRTGSTDCCPSTGCRGCERRRLVPHARDAGTARAHGGPRRRGRHAVRRSRHRLRRDSGLRRQDEAVAGARLDGVVSHEIRLRYRDDIAGGWRIRAGARVFRVLAASDPDLGRRQILCLVEEEGA